MWTVLIGTNTPVVHRRHRLLGLPAQQLGDASKVAREGADHPLRAAHESQLCVEAIDHRAAVASAGVGFKVAQPPTVPLVPVLAVPLVLLPAALLFVLAGPVALAVVVLPLSAAGVRS